VKYIEVQTVFRDDLRSMEAFQSAISDISEGKKFTDKNLDPLLEAADVQRRANRKFVRTPGITLIRRMLPRPGK